MRTKFAAQCCEGGNSSSVINPPRRLTQVIRRSVSPSSRRIVLDAGQKAASVDSGLPKLAHVSGGCLPDLLFCPYPLVLPLAGVQEYRNGGDEHLIALFDSSVDSSHIPALGAKLKLIPGHCDPTVAMHNVMYAVRDGKVKDIWPIATHRS